jgi:hypothetical protein
MSLGVHKLWENYGFGLTSQIFDLQNRHTIALLVVTGLMPLSITTALTSALSRCSLNCERLIGARI